MTSDPSSNSRMLNPLWSERNNMTPLRKRLMEDLQLKGYTPATQQAYLHAVCKLARHYGKSPDQVTEEELRAYFLVSVDIVNWDNNLQQALVILARGSGLSSTADSCPLDLGACPPGFATTSGYVCNYDPNQSGIGSGGQLQINRVTGEWPLVKAQLFLAEALASGRTGKVFQRVLCRQLLELQEYVPNFSLVADRLLEPAKLLNA